MSQYSVLSQSVINSSRVTLIGVNHNSNTHKNTTEQVIERLNPDVIGVEASPDKWKIADSGALGKSGECAVRIAREEKIDIALIDEDNTLPPDKSTEEKLKSPIPKEIDDIVVDKLEERREDILDDTRSDYVLHSRENKMSKVISALTDLYDDIVIVVGAAHIMGISERLKYVEEDVLPEDRLITLSDPVDD